MTTVLILLGIALVVAVLLVLPRFVRRRILDAGEPTQGPGASVVDDLRALGAVEIVGWDTEPGVFTAVAGIAGHEEPTVLRMWPASGALRHHDLSTLDAYLVELHDRLSHVGEQPTLVRPPEIADQIGPWLAGVVSRRWPE